MQKTNDYGQLSAQFGVVRRAWKRAAALSGLAVVVTEGVGIFTALLFLDWLYQPQPIVRIIVAVLALAGLAYLIVRHVVKPLLRKIPDDQIALYIEEHRSDLDGVLITAAEFGRKREGMEGRQAALIDAVVKQAVTRSSKTSVGRVVDFSRLRKYGFAAAIGIGAYLVLGLLFPNVFAHHFGRVLQPWQLTDEDKVRQSVAAAKAEPLHFTLSKGDTSLARGTSFDFDVTLSKAKPGDQAVVLYFRPRSGTGDWQKIAMAEIEKLNGFHGALTDVSEDLEFYVACGNDKSDSHKLSVYDPLVVQSLEMATHFPDYVKQADRIDKPSTGDVTALVGSKVTLRVLTSTTLKEGQIKWSDGQTQPVTVDPQADKTATVTFEAKADGTYDYTLTDVNGQQAVSAAPLSVHVIPDTPPTIEVKSPTSPLLTHALGEVKFNVVAGDDFGIAGMDLVYSRIGADTEAPETRIPLPLKTVQSKDSPNGVETNYLLSLETFQPPLKFNDTITYRVEARDAKGQVATSSIGFIIIGYYENWATWATPEHGSEVHNETGADLMAILSLVWELDNQKSQISPDEIKKRSTEIASKMVDGQGGMLSWVDTAKMPQLTRVEPQINAHAKKAHEALVATDLPKALAEITTAVAILAGNGIKEDLVMHQSDPESVVGSHFSSPTVTMLEQARMNALAQAAKDKNHSEKDKADADAAAAAAQAVADLVKKQDALIAKAQGMAPQAGKADEGPKGDQDKQAPSAGAKGEGKGGPGAAGAAQLAADQHDLAEKTRAAAEKAKAAAGGAAAAAGAKGSAPSKLDQAADKTAAAAKLMEEASRAFAANKTDEAKAKANEAQTTLRDAGTTLQNTDRSTLEAAISDAAQKASAILEKQKDLNAQTDALAKDLGDKKPDQRQQRDLQKQAYQQTQLGAQAEALNSQISDLNDQAAKVGQPEAVRALGDAQKIVKRSQPQAKMSNAIIDLNNATPAAASTEQKTAVAALEKVVGNLQTGADSLAGSRDAQLSRARRVAEEAKKSLAGLMAQAGIQPKQPGTQPGKEAGTQPGTQPGQEPGKTAGTQPGQEPGKTAGTQPGQEPGKTAGTQPGQEPGKTAGTQPGQEPGKTAGTQPGQEPGKTAGTQPGQEPGKTAGTQPGTEPGKTAGTQPGTEPGTQGNGNGGGEDEVRKLAYNIGQLAAAVDNRQLVPQDEADQLKQMSMDKAELEKKLTVDPKFLQDVAMTVDNINNQIEAELEAKTQASKLFSSQREECPPAYRQFVNKYFEALSQTSAAPASGTPPAPSGQP